jgi:hypothetical protein
MRRRRSWRLSGCACSRTRPCGSVRSPNLHTPRCLRLGPPRPASASQPANVGGQANRCQRTAAGGRRGDGPQCRSGLPSGLLRPTGMPAESTVEQREVMPPPMSPQQATTPVSPTMLQMSRHRARLASKVGSAHAPPLVVAFRSGPCTTSLPRPGRPRDGSRSPRLSARPGVPHNEHW